jgi:ketosteroid isomerase-like protein
VRVAARFVQERRESSSPRAVLVRTFQPGRTFAPDTTKGADMATNNEQAIRHLYYVAEAKTEDLKAFAECYTEDGEFIDMSSGATYRGKSEVWKTVAIFSKAFPDMHRDIHHLSVVGDIVFVELTLQGTHKGPLELPIGTILATGKKMNAPCCDIFRLVNGKVKLFTCYVEASMVFAQLGVFMNLQAALTH